MSISAVINRTTIVISQLSPFRVTTLTLNLQVGIRIRGSGFRAKVLRVRAGTVWLSKGGLRV